MAENTAVETKQPFPYGIEPYTETGPLAPEVASMAKGAAYAALHEWLTHVGAPEEAQTLLEAVDLYSAYEVASQQEGFKPWSTEEIEFLPKALNAVAIMGGEFEVMDGCHTVGRTMPGLSAPAGASENAKFMRLVASRWPALSEDAKARIGRLIGAPRDSARVDKKVQRPTNGKKGGAK